MNAYDLARGLHILAVIAWMAGLLYLPRLFAYHTRAAVGGEMDETFQTMERKALKVIMRRATLAAWADGPWLIWLGRGPGAGGREMDETCQTMERKLLKVSMSPAMVAAWAAGLWLIWLRRGSGADWSFLAQPWMIAKLSGVVFLTGWHDYLARASRRLATG